MILTRRVKNVFIINRRFSIHIILENVPSLVKEIIKRIYYYNHILIDVEIMKMNVEKAVNSLYVN